MTCKEKLMKDRPDLFEEYDIQTIIEEDCPQDYMDILKPEDCTGGYCDVCEKCWNREFMDPKTVERIAEAFDNAAGYTVSPKELKAALEHAAEHPEKTPAGMIKDSGDRTQFETGAVRDMREGKGRCDLAPLEVVAEIIQSPVIRLISEFQKTRDTRHLYLALDQFAIEMYTVNEDTDTQTEVNATMCLEVAKHFEEGAKKYGENNWQKGIPVYCYIDSAVRHYLKCVHGDDDEPHARAFVWNLMCCIWEVDYHKTTVEEET